MIVLPFENRGSAGRALAGRLGSDCRWNDPLVLALPRGGVPVAAEVASALSADLDLMMVRKIGTPGQPEFAMGAVASGDICLRSEGAIAMADVSDEEFQQVRKKEDQELNRRECRYRNDRPFPWVRGRSVILVDDGLATGTTMLAAVQAVARLHPMEIVVAVPVGSRGGVAKVARVVDEVLCLATPEPFLAVGLHYFDFSQVSDDEVCSILRSAWRRAEQPIQHR